MSQKSMLILILAAAIAAALLAFGWTSWTQPSAVAPGTTGGQQIEGDTDMPEDQTGYYKSQEAESQQGVDPSQAKGEQ